MSALLSASDTARALPRSTSNASISLPTPAELRAVFPVEPRVGRAIEAFRSQIIDLVHGRDDRLLCVVGPCSIHDPAAALEYASRLLPVAERLRDDLLIVMRVYLEKPRSSVGWKGLISDPHLDGRCDIGHGLCLARELMTAIAGIGLPMATELLDGNLSTYFSDLLSWAAIGARTSESQPHRELASALPFAVGFKNGTDGRIDGALGGIRSAREPHRRLAPDEHGRIHVLQSAGNPNCHVTLRGGSNGPNYAPEHVTEAHRRAAAANLPARILVDCSHGNSGKDHQNQARVVESVAAQVARGGSHVLGVMIESHLVAGQQALGCPTRLRYGQSITDACVDFAATEALLEQLVGALGERRRQAAALTPRAAVTC